MIILSSSFGFTTVDDTVKDIFKHVLALVQLIVETMADEAGIGASLCLGIFLEKAL